MRVSNAQQAAPQGSRSHSDKRWRPHQSPLSKGLPPFPTPDPSDMPRHHTQPLTSPRPLCAQPEMPKNKDPYPSPEPPGRQLPFPHLPDSCPANSSHPSPLAGAKGPALAPGGGSLLPNSPTPSLLPLLNHCSSQAPPARLYKRGPRCYHGQQPPQPEGPGSQREPRRRQTQTPD